MQENEITYKIRGAIFKVYKYFNDTATTEIYTLSLHDALPIWSTKKRFAISCNGTDLRWRSKWTCHYIITV